MKILLIEDNLLQLDFLTAALSDDDFTIVATSNPSDALRLAVQHMPDLIITDLSMPGKDGFQLTRDFKGHPLLSEIPVLAVSADTSKEAIRGALHAGIVDYIEKPIQSNYLKKLIRFHSSTNRMTGALREWQTVLDNVATANNQVNSRH